jgi:hypothetical protein
VYPFDGPGVAVLDERIAVAAGELALVATGDDEVGVPVARVQLVKRHHERLTARRMGRLKVGAAAGAPASAAILGTSSGPGTPATMREQAYTSIRRDHLGLDGHAR